MAEVVVEETKRLGEKKPVVEEGSAGPWSREAAERHSQYRRYSQCERLLTSRPTNEQFR